MSNQSWQTQKLRRRDLRRRMLSSDCPLKLLCCLAILLPFLLLNTYIIVREPSSIKRLTNRGSRTVGVALYIFSANDAYTVRPSLHLPSGGGSLFLIGSVQQILRGRPVLAFSFSYRSYHEQTNLYRRVVLQCSRRCTGGHCCRSCTHSRVAGFLNYRCRLSLNNRQAIDATSARDHGSAQAYCFD